MGIVSLARRWRITYTCITYISYTSRTFKDNQDIQTLILWIHANNDLCLRTYYRHSVTEGTTWISNARKQRFTQTSLSFSALTDIHASHAHHPSSTEQRNKDSPDMSSIYKDKCLWCYDECITLEPLAEECATSEPNTKPYLLSP